MENIVFQQQLITSANLFIHFIVFNYYFLGIINVDDNIL